MNKTETTDFLQLVADVTEGSQDAAWELINQYHALVFRVVRKRLPDELRRAFDSQDLVQIAWASIFRHRSRLCRFETPDEFVRFLATVAANKVALEVRRRMKQQKRDVKRERPLDAVAEKCLGNEPSPSQVAIAREKWFRMLANQPEHYQEIIRLRYLGYTSPEIAERVKLDEGNVRRIVRRILRNA